MTLLVKDHVREANSFTGLGDVTLTGTVVGRNTAFVASIGNGNSTFACIENRAAVQWEIGVYNIVGGVLVRSTATILSSSNAGALVDFTSGVKDIYCTAPASRLPLLNAAGTVLSGPAKVESVAASASAVLTTRRTGVGANAQVTGIVEFRGGNAASTDTLFAKTQTVITDATAASEDADWEVWTMAAGALTRALYGNAATMAVIGALTVGSTVDAVSGYKINGLTFADRDSTYARIYNVGGGVAEYLSAANNYYDSDIHNFRKSNHSTVMATLTDTLMAATAFGFLTDTNTYAKLVSSGIYGIYPGGLKLAQFETPGAGGCYLALIANNTPSIVARSGSANQNLQLSGTGISGVDLMCNNTGQYMARFGTHGTAGNMVNYWAINGNITGAAVEFIATGSDSNIDTFMTAKGTGVHKFGNPGSVAGKLALAGSTSGSTTLTPVVSGGGTLTLPASGTIIDLEGGLAYRVANVAALKALTTRPLIVVTEGALTSGVGWGIWRWEAGSVTTADDATVVNPTSGTAGRYKLLTSGEINAQVFGVKGDGVTNDSAALIAAGLAATGLTLRIPPGTYLCDSFAVYGGTTVFAHGAVFKPWTTTIITTNITTTNGSTAATVASAAGLVNGMYVGAVGVLDGTTFSGLSGTSITLSQAATASATVSATFGNQAALSVVDLNGDGIKWYGGKILGNITTGYGVLVAPYYTMRVMDVVNATGRPSGIVIEDLEVVGGMQGIATFGVDQFTMRGVVSTDHYGTGTSFGATSGNGGPEARKIFIGDYRAERCGVGEGIKFGSLYAATGATTTISTTNNSNSATVASATGILVNQLIISANVPLGTTVTNIAGTTITMSGNATATAAGTSAVFGWPPYSDIEFDGLTIRDCGRMNPDSSYWQEGVDLFMNACDKVLITRFAITGCGNGGIEVKRFTPSVYVSPNRMYDIKISDGIISCDYDTCVGIALNRSGPDTENETIRRVSIDNVEFLLTAGTASYAIAATAYSDVHISNCQFYGAFHYDISVSIGALDTPDETARRWTIGGCKASGADTFFSTGTGNIDDFVFLPNDVTTTDDTFVFSSATKWMANVKITGGGRYETSDSAGFVINMACPTAADGLLVSGKAHLKSPNYVINLTRGNGRIEGTTLQSTSFSAIRVANDYVMTPTITTVNGSPNITVSSATSLRADMVIASANVPGGTTVVSVSGTTVVMSANATAGASGTAATFTPSTVWEVCGNQVRVPTTQYLWLAGSTPGTIYPWDNVRGSDTAAPTIAGTVGEVVKHRAPAAAGFREWTCTTAGASGAAVWKQTATIAA